MTVNETKPMTERGRSAYTKILMLMDEMPTEKLYYILGYMQSEAEKNLQSGGNANG